MIQYGHHAIKTTDEAKVNKSKKQKKKNEFIISKSCEAGRCHSCHNRYCIHSCHRG